MNVLVAAVEAVTDTMIVPIKYERSGSFGKAKEVEVAAGVVPMVVLSEIKYERSSSFLAKSFLAKRLFCFDFVIWLPRCFGYETEEKQKEKEESEGERKWMALLKDLIF